VPTWEEAVRFVGTAAGVYPELKTPLLYRARNIDQTGLLAAAVRQLGLDREPSRLIVRSFDDVPLRERGVREEAILDQLQPRQRRAAVGIQERDDVANRLPASRFARHHESFARLVDHAHARDGSSHGGRFIGARIVDDQDFVGNAVCASDWRHGARNAASLWAQTMTLILDVTPAPLLVTCRGIPTCMDPSLLKGCDAAITPDRRLC
jgi:hypothetical protein